MAPSSESFYPVSSSLDDNRRKIIYSIFGANFFFSLSKMRKDKVCCVGCPKMSLTMIYDLPFSLRNEEFDRPQTENDNLCNICKHTAELEKGFFGFVSHAMWVSVVVVIIIINPLFLQLKSSLGRSTTMMTTLRFAFAHSLGSQFMPQMDFFIYDNVPRDEVVVLSNGRGSLGLSPSDHENEQFRPRKERKRRRLFVERMKKILGWKLFRFSSWLFSVQRFLSVVRSFSRCLEVNDETQFRARSFFSSSSVVGSIRSSVRRSVVGRCVRRRPCDIDPKSN